MCLTHTDLCHRAVNCLALACHEGAVIMQKASVQELNTGHDVGHAYCYLMLDVAC